MGPRSRTVQVRALAGCGCGSGAAHQIQVPRGAAGAAARGGGARSGARSRHQVGQAPAALGATTALRRHHLQTHHAYHHMMIVLLNALSFNFVRISSKQILILPCVIATKLFISFDVGKAYTGCLEDG